MRSDDFRHREASEHDGLELVRPFVDDQDSNYGIMVNEDGGDNEEETEGKKPKVDEDSGDSEEGIEGRKPKVMKTPVKPSKDEIEAHDASGHVPYRSWCPHCVRGRGVDSPHRTHDPGEMAVPQIGVDYGHLTSKGDPDRPHFLVGRSNKSGDTYATGVPHKGPGEPWLVEEFIDWLDSLGYNKISIRCDKESSIGAWAKEVKRLRIEETIIEPAITGDPKTNGMAECAVKEVKGVMRSIIDHIESHCGDKLQSDDVIIMWIIKHAALMISRYKVGSDGMTPYERTKGKKASQPMVCIGERVLFMPLKAARGDKMDVRFEYGIYVGTSFVNSEHYVATEGGVIRTRTIRRLPMEDRWKIESIRSIKGTPWAPLDGESPMPIGIKIKEGTGQHDIPPPPIRPEIQIRRMQLSKADFAKYGFTPGCQGCRGIQLKVHRALNHTDACRSRVEAAIGEDPEGAARVEKNNQRINEQMAKNIEDADEDKRGSEDADGRRGDGYVSSVSSSGSPKGSSSSSDEPSERSAFIETV